jgi:hypothetical protein
MFVIVFHVVKLKGLNAKDMENANYYSLFLCHRDNHLVTCKERHFFQIL